MTAQNSIESTPARPVGRPFKPGQSGNPGGRRKGLTGRIKEATDDGKDLVDFVVGVFHDDKEPTKVRLEAASWLADRGFGRPALQVELAQEAPVFQIPDREAIDARLAELEAKYGPKALGS